MNYKNSQQLTIQQAISRAKKATKKGKIADAVELYTAVLAHQPNHPIAKKMLRELQKELPQNKSVKEEASNPPQNQITALVNLYHSGQMVKAEQACRELLNTYPQTLVAINVLGVTLKGQGKLQEAVQVYNKAIQLNPNYAEVRFNRGAALQELGQLNEAIASYDMAIQLKPDYAKAYSNRGNALKQLGQLDESLKSYDKAIQLKPDYAEAYSNRGNSLKDLGRLDEALQNYDKATQLKPDFAEAYSNHGITLQLLGRLDEAIKNYEKAIQLKPDFATAYNSRGGALHVLGQLDAAMRDYEKAIQLKPDFADAYTNRGNALKDLGRLNEAVASCDKAIQLNPDFAIAYNSRGAALHIGGQLDAAMQDYDKAIQLSLDSAEAYSNRGAALQELGQPDAAMQGYDKAIQLKPDYAEAHYNRHALLLNPDDIMPAIKCMEKAIDIDPLNMDYRFVLGMLWDYSGDTQKATTHFDLVESGESLYRARLDAWRYIKSVNKKMPTIIGSNIHAFKLGIEAAVVDGLVLEFGVRFGTSIRQISTLVDQDVYGFDSFQGLPESWHSEPKGAYSTKGVIPSVPQNVILHDGWFEKTLPGFVQQHPEPVRFMNIDCDIYSSTKTVLEIFAKQIIPGTVIVFDEYIGNEHWREDEFKAFQEAVLKYGWKYEYLCFSFMTKQVVVRIN